MTNKKQEQKEYLDKMLSDNLHEILERKAQYYKKVGFERQAKKIRAFKKQVREMVGSL
jgi:AraC-like DNA-binding protein